ncbi:MAG: PAS and helix-turn-helix domain-containing protein [Phycisphaerales bacterium]|nr:PAS and helix-turn-helix domain-containing protein [Phycisphaerales bacterium]
MKPGPSSESVGGTVGALSLLSDPAARILWEALTQDTPAEILLLSPQGKIVQANPQAEGFLGADRGALAGTQYRDLYPDAVASERLAYISEVARTGRRIVLEGVVKGAWRQTTLRQISLPDVHVLLINRPSAISAGDAGHPREPVEPSIRGERIRAKHDDLGELAALTVREREILALIGRGLSTVEIAEHLGRSVKTIEWHRVSLGNKLGITNRVELAHIALRAGLAQIETPGASSRVSKPSRQTSKPSVRAD